MIYTLTFNPSLDHYVRLHDFKAHALNRVLEEKIITAGKGINVAKILHELGQEVCVWGFVAGFSGDKIVADLAKEKIACDMLRLAQGDTRINVKINDGHETEINGIGPKVDKNDIQALIAKVTNLKARDTLVISGSLANGMDIQDLVMICSQAYQKDVRLVLDMADQALLACLQYRPFLIKPNKQELDQLFGKDIPADEIALYAQKLQSLGAQNVLVSLGAQGALLVDDNQKIHQFPSMIGKIVASVGAGDSMVAGYLYHYDRYHDHQEALGFALSCASATCFAPVLASSQDIMMTYEKWYKLYHPHKRYFFFDIDGTLTDNATKKVVPSALKALKKLQAAGHFVAIATGRAHYKASMMMEELGLHNMVCSGGKCLVMNDEIVENIPLDRDKVLAIIAQATSLGYGILAMIDDSIDVYAKDDLFCQQVGPRKEPTNYIIDPNIDFTQIPHFYKLYVAISSDQENRLTLKESLGHLRFVKDYLMFQHDAKDEGICLFMDKLQQDHKDVVVFGDDHNDLVMFKPRWTSIAMGNACSELKAKATYVTAKNVDDGIYQACEKFGWFKQI